MRVKTFEEEPKAEPTLAEIALHKEIGQGVLRKLGIPPAFEKVDVHPLYLDRYRINVIVRDDTRPISDSFFVMTNGDGRIVATSPTIKARYKHEEIE